MDEITLRPEDQAELAAAVGRLWECAHGAPAGTVCVLIGADSLAVLIKNVLSPAERVAARRAEGQALVQRYAKQLLATLAPALRALIESFTGRRVISTSGYADTVAGHVLCFYFLGERLASPVPGVEHCGG